MSNNMENQGFNFSQQPYATPVEGRIQKKPVNVNNGMGLSYVPPQPKPSATSSTQQFLHNLYTKQAESTRNKVQQAISEPSTSPVMQLRGYSIQPQKPLEGSHQIAFSQFRVNQRTRLAKEILKAAYDEGRALSQNDKNLLRQIVGMMVSEKQGTKGYVNTLHKNTIEKFLSGSGTVKEILEDIGFDKSILQGGKRKQRKTKKQKRKAKKTRKH